MVRQKGKFCCHDCGRQWTSVYAKENETQICLHCKSSVLPSKLKSIDGYKPFPEKMRLFGEFRCPKCKKFWKSANCWENTWQRCKNCKTEVHPELLRPLLRGSGPQDKDKPHPREHCQKCIELGRYCGTQAVYYPPSAYEEAFDDSDDDDDDDGNDDGYDDDDDDVNALAGALAVTTLNTVEAVYQ